MDDAHWTVGRYGDEFTQRSVAVGADDQQAVLAVLLVLDQA